MALGTVKKGKKNKDSYKKEVLADYFLACLSRGISVTSRKEVLSGKAKFGIMGAGKEVAQIAMAKTFQDGDFRSGYYRDQTFMLALDLVTPEQLFAQLYADCDLEREPHSGGRQMNSHFSTHSLNEDGSWKNLSEQKNSSSDISPTGSQMGRAVGLAMASKKYRSIAALKDQKGFTKNGNEVSFVTIGDASTSEGVFWEALNAAGVMNIPMAVSIWDDGYGISVPTKYQTTKESIYKVIKGFEKDAPEESGYYIHQAKGWDYEGLCKMYRESVPKIRENHSPTIFHIDELTQPQGHSTSGSHERYKSKERLKWERDFDCVRKMREWILDVGYATKKELEKIEEDAEVRTKEARDNAWAAYRESVDIEKAEVLEYLNACIAESAQTEAISKIKASLLQFKSVSRTELIKAAKEVLLISREEANLTSIGILKSWLQNFQQKYQYVYSHSLFSTSDQSALNVPGVPATFDEHSPMKNGYEVINTYFNKALAKYPELLAFGEDVGNIGDVNQGFAGLQEIYGEERVFDTGIRENTIIGQGIGMALRGLRPIAEIQYIDYFIYGFQPIVDDLSTVRYRSVGKQKAPLIVRTRGHRLEGIWHTGSPMGMILNGVRGVYLAVPRNMTQAAGFYNTLLQGDDPGIVVECLNGYRLKEKLPNNLLDFTVPLGKVEVLQEGTDLTLVSYGSTLRVANNAILKLKQVGISVELIDVQCLLPFDLNHDIVKSISKTNRVIFLDEDVPGGASAYMMQQVLENQNAYQHLDSAPVTISATEHRTPFGTDGDYFSKPNPEQIFERIYEIMHEANPSAFPMFY